MFEITPLIISITIILAGVLGIIIGRLISKSSYKDESSNKSHEEHFHVDRATGIVSDISSFKC